MRTTKPITVSLPADLVRETQRGAKEESRTRSDLIRDALQQYLASRRWRGAYASGGQRQPTISGSRPRLISSASSPRCRPDHVDQHT
jgi:Arc/MetJ-type ribon-helix-helix transcriptional regulator